eukprot:14906591-Alexandrium_andersonii.AAC.1
MLPGMQYRHETCETAVPPERSFWNPRIQLPARIGMHSHVSPRRHLCFPGPWYPQPHSARH